MALLRRGGLAALLLASLLAVPGAAPAQTASEYDVKALFLYNFAKFVDWPPAAFPDPDKPEDLRAGRGPVRRQPGDGRG